MRRLTSTFIPILVLVILTATGCEDVVRAPANDKLDEGPSSITITSGGEESGDTVQSESDSTLYDFNDLDWECVNDNDFGTTYADLTFNESHSWAVCTARSDTEGHDGMAILPSDTDLHHNKNNGTTQLDDDRVILPEPADSVSLVTANYDRPKVDYMTKRDYSSWLVAYDEAGNEIDRALNNKGNYIGVELVVRADQGTKIHSVGIETYPSMTYFDNLKTWISTGPPPDTTAPEFTYTVVSDTLASADRQLRLAVSGISADDDRGGPVVLTVSVVSSEDVIGPGNPTAPDWELLDNGDGSVDVTLRAEYSNNQTGRTYTVSMKAEDTSGNVAEDSVDVYVSRKSEE